jgi:hypothetical protein
MATDPRRPFAGTGRNPIPSTPDSLPDWLQVPYSGHRISLRETGSGPHLPHVARDSGRASGRCGQTDCEPGRILPAWPACHASTSPDRLSVEPHVPGATLALPEPHWLNVDTAPNNKARDADLVACSFVGGVSRPLTLALSICPTLSIWPCLSGSRSHSNRS